MRKIYSLLVAALISVSLFAQIPSKVKWDVTSKTISETEAEIHFKANIESHWHMWSQNPGDEMLIPTTVKIKSNPDIELIGKPREVGKKITVEEEGFDNPLHYYENTLTLIQKIKYKKATKIDAEIELQTCNREGMCLPPEYKDVSINFKPEKIAATTNDVVATPETDAKEKTEIKEEDTESDEDVETLDAEDKTDEAVIIDTTSTTDNMTESTESTGEITSYGIFGTPLADCVQQEDKLNMWTAFIAGIIGGFLALFFPCTFPMIPLTMSFFLKGKKDEKSKKDGIKKAIFYGFSIFLVYFLLSLPFYFFNLGGDALNNLSTSVWLNLVFFAVFIYFAFSLFGFYDISLPSGISNKIDSKGDFGSYLGIFFLALTLAIVSFSCTGPILGLVLANLQNAKLIMPAMSGFGIGLGLPFALFALSPNLLESLPKSGSWLNVMKVIFGFIELAFAFKFLSNADLVMQWGLLKREIFVIIWIIISALTGLYLFGKFKFKKSDSDIKQTNITRVLGILCFLFVGYLATDFFGGDLKEISGFPPPKSYSIFHQEEKFDIIKNDYKGALAQAKAEGKLLLLDCTGYACVNCRKMEENVWIQPEIYDLMKRKFVITSLYVDEKVELPKEEQTYSETLKRNMKTKGDIWMEFEMKNLHQATQPLYAIIDPDTERIVNSPVGGYMSVADFKAFLNCGIKFQESKK